MSPFWANKLDLVNCNVARDTAGNILYHIHSSHEGEPIRNIYQIYMTNAS